jgi:diguanylate cyclase (GGDEF)-like protein/PAS domain S-box-containing protein
VSVVDETRATPPSSGGHAQALESLRYQQALSAGQIGTWWLDMETGMAQWDAIAAEILGLDTSETSSTALVPVHPDDRTAVAESLERSFTKGSVHDIEFRPLHNDEEAPRWVRSIARPAATSGIGKRWLTGVLLDVTERRNIETELRESRRQIQTLLNNLPGVAYRCEAQRPWRMEFISDAVAEMTGYSAADMHDPEMGWAHLMHPDDVARIQRQVEEAIAAHTTFSVRYRIVHRNGETKWVHERGEPGFDEAGRACFIEGFIWDVSDQQAADEKLQWTASHDALTKLPNRILFQQRMDEALKHASHCGTQVGILLLDVDDFKIINDTLGHDAGDTLLRTIAERLTLSIRPGDMAARLSGDEFAVLVENGADRTMIQRTGTKIMASFEEPFAHDGRLFDCKASVGLSIFPEGGATRMTLMKDADIALYAAKAEGGGRMKFYERHMRHEMESRSSMLQLARDALLNDWIVPHYQPKIDLATGAISGFEALLRWEHPEKGLQSPDTVAAAFHDLDLAASISDRMIKLVIADILRWQDADLNFGHVAINAAAAEFRRGNFPETLLGRLSDADLSPENIQIEVTESVFLGRGAEYVDTALRLLNAAGVAIALDDFGTGYASLSHLKQFPVNAIKIDRSFIRDLHSDPDDAAIVRAVISLGKSLGIKIVAEGIETQEQAAYLRKHGCDFGQGYLFGAAVAGDQVGRVLSAAKSSMRRRKAA